MGKTTVAASLAVAAAKTRKRVLVVTIDPARRLMQAFGFKDALQSESGAPLLLSSEVKAELGLAEEASLSVAMLNPKYVLEQIMAQTLAPAQAAKLKGTTLYSEMSQMIYGLQEYTAYEWVTRMLMNNEYDLIVLDTPPAFHAKDFFNAPEKIQHLLESRVFQLFVPKKHSWFSFGSKVSFGWIEKLLGSTTFRESVTFFETFVLLRDRILERAQLLSKFFVKQDVAVIAVSTPESTALLELDGLVTFLKQKQIPLESIVMNQVEERSPWIEDPAFQGLNPEMLQKLKSLNLHQNARADRADLALSKVKAKYSSLEVIRLPMSYSRDGLEILRKNASQI